MTAGLRRPLAGLRPNGLGVSFFCVMLRFLLLPVAGLWPHAAIQRWLGVGSVDAFGLPVVILYLARAASGGWYDEP